MDHLTTHLKWATAQLLVTEVRPNGSKAISLETWNLLTLKRRNTGTDGCYVRSSGLAILTLRRRNRKCDHT